MKVYTLTHTQSIDRPLREIFSFFENPENLSRLTPQSLNFKILTPPPIIMKAGTLIDYTIEVFKIEHRWRTLITAYEPPYRFVDEQLEGPYSFWHHTHTFSESGKMTVIKDEVRYALPLGWIGGIARELIVKKQLEEIFNYREKAIFNYFNASSSK